MKMFWCIPSHGDSRHLGTARGARAATFDYFKQVALAADGLGYEGVLLPTGRSCEDSWMLASSLIDATRRLRFLVALRPGLVQPAQLARMSATFDRLSGGRLLVNLLPGGDPEELQGDGLFLSHAERWAQAREFIGLWRELLACSHDGGSLDHEGAYYRLRGGKLLYAPLQRPHPPVFVSGSSDVAHDLAAEHADTYLSWGEPPADVAAKLADVRRRAARRGRTLSAGIRLHVIVRETEGEAWRAASDLLGHLDPAVVDAAQRRFAAMDSVGQRRMADLHGGHFNPLDLRDGLEVSPNLWAGIGLVRGGAGTALVGNPRQVAERLLEYAALDIDHFILSGYPHLEEAHRVAELVFPLLPLHLRAQLAQPAPSGPFGEIVANTIVPPAVRH